MIVSCMVSPAFSVTVKPLGDAGHITWPCPLGGVKQEPPWSLMHDSATKPCGNVSVICEIVTGAFVLLLTTMVN